MSRHRTFPGDAPLLLTLSTMLVVGCGEREPAMNEVLAIDVDSGLRERIARLSPLPPVPGDPTNRVADDPAAAHLGQFLFFDERLSANGQVSCATCHDPKRSFTDGETLAVGLSRGTRHTPSLWNVAHQRWLTWDGRADSLWMQALDPIEDVREMGTTRTAVARLVATDDELRTAYEGIFGPLPEALGDVTSLPSDARPARGDPEHPHVAAWERLAPERRDAVTTVLVNLAKCIAAYQRLLVRADAPFDRFVAGLRTGDPNGVAELDAAAQRGLALFLGRANCILCHSGPNFSDGEFHNNALPTLHGGEPRDAGRYAGAAVVKASEFHAAGPYSDAPESSAGRRVRQLRESSESWGEFRTPSLRNLAQRAPFMHQGQFSDLDAVLDFYSTLEGSSGRNHHQEVILVPLELTPQERSDLRAFLDSLEGAPIDEALASPPASPVAGTS